MVIERVDAREHPSENGQEIRVELDQDQATSVQEALELLKESESFDALALLDAQENMVHVLSGIGIDSLRVSAGNQLVVRPGHKLTAPSETTKNRHLTIKPIVELIITSDTPSPVSGKTSPVKVYVAEYDQFPQNHPYLAGAFRVALKGAAGLGKLTGKVTNRIGTSPQEALDKAREAFITVKTKARRKSGS